MRHLNFVIQNEYILQRGKRGDMLLAKIHASGVIENLSTLLNGKKGECIFYNSSDKSFYKYYYKEKGYVEKMMCIKDDKDGTSLYVIDGKKEIYSFTFNSIFLRQVSKIINQEEIPEEYFSKENKISKMSQWCINSNLYTLSRFEEDMVFYLKTPEKNFLNAKYSPNLKNISLDEREEIESEISKHRESIINNIITKPMHTLKPTKRELKGEVSAMKRIFAVFITNSILAIILVIIIQTFSIFEPYRFVLLVLLGIFTFMWMMKKIL